MEIDTVLDDSKKGNYYNPALDELLQCNNGSAFQNIKQQAETGLKQAFDSACTAIQSLCEDPHVHCVQQNCTEADIQNYDNNVRDHQ